MMGWDDDKKQEVQFEQYFDHIHVGADCCGIIN